jgi:hypothetical protein
MIGVGRADWFLLPLPPNRTCRSPASGSPVGGLTCKRTDEFGPGYLQANSPCRSKNAYYLSPLTPVSRAVSIRSVPTDGSAHAQSRLPGGS